jgi:N,N'-diacetyllegionaminate synthase
MNKVHTIIIAEAGVNHNGSIKIAKKMIDVASKAGADFIKFQTFKSENLVTKKAEQAQYQKKNDETNQTQFEMLKKLELDLKSHEELISYCNKKNIQFLSTAFDIESLKMLEDFNLPFYKIPSGEITNLPFLKHVGGQKKPIIMSTGMSTLEEVKKALNVLIDSGSKKDEITILHCNTEYPTPIIDVNLRAMLTIKERLKVEVGYSDHTLGIEISLAAVALGAKIIEKHFTLDRNMLGPDQAASLEPNELSNLVSSIRNIEKAFGNSIKKPSNSEKKNIKVIRKSIVAKDKILKGDFFSNLNLTVKRPANGLSPMNWNKVIGQIAKKNFNIDEIIEV